MSKRRTKFEVKGFEAIEKTVGVDHHCGRIYLPNKWIGEKVLVVRQ